MSQTTEPSMYERPERPDWPLNALPKHWIEALFSKMSAFYGSKFAAMWSGSKPAEVQKAWAIELAKLTREQLKAGSDALTAFSRPPTLPDFVAHCKQTRAEMAEHRAPKLEHRAPIDPERAKVALGMVHTAAAKIAARAPTAEWAYRLLMSGRKDLSHEVVRCATDAITSSAGRRVVDECPDEALKSEYAEVSQATVDGCRMRGTRLWGVR